MHGQSILDLLQMYNGFAKEGIITHFWQEASETFDELYSNDTFSIAIIIRAYTQIRDSRIFDEWFTTTVEYKGSQYMVLCQLYRNRIFEIWMIS